MKTNEVLPVGTVLDSGVRKYEILSVLGQGGFGITYLAKSVVHVDNIPVEVMFAIKEHFISSMNGREGTSVIISNDNNKLEIAESINSFISEAVRLNKLSMNHSSIVRVNEHFRTNNTAYYVMEYVKGKSLRQHVKLSAQGKLDEDKALQLFRPIAQAIAYLHQNKVTHLDIKPDNILIRENGQPVLIDFGLSKHYSSKGTPTSTIKALGCSDGYSPMEQYAGIKTFTPEADIYALAATLFFMLTGKDPIISTDITKSFIQNGLPNGLSEQTANAIMKAMAKLKEDRTAKVEDLLNALYSENDESNNTDVEKEKEKEKITKKIKKDGFKFHISKKAILWFLGAIAVALLVFLLYPRDDKWKTEATVEELAFFNSTEDSLAYAIGMKQVVGLKEYLSTLDVGTTLTDEFLEGFDAGSRAEDEDLLAMPDYDDDAKTKAYNTGFEIGKNARGNLWNEINLAVYEDSAQSLPFDYFRFGFEDEFRSAAMMDMEEADAFIETGMAKIKAQRYEGNKLAGEEFLENNKYKDGVHVLPSGVQYMVIKQGTGAIPDSDSEVTVHYEGRLLDGTVFDSSYSGEPAQFRCNQLIKGFTDALTNMPAGSIWEVYIPQELAYGEQQAGQIPPYSMLIFKIELITVTDSAAAKD